MSRFERTPTPRRAALAVAALFGTIALSPAAEGARGASGASKSAGSPPAGGSPFVAKWNAIGPGCPGMKDAAEGTRPDVPFTHRPPTKEEPRTHVFRFTLGKQRVSSPRPTGEETRELAFGAECSIRMVLEPPGGSRIAGAVARSTYRITKAEGPEAWILSDLQLGNKTVAKRRVDFPSGASVSSRSEELVLVPGRTPEESMPETRCGQPKILGLDTIFAVKRKSMRDAIEISLGEGAVVEVVVDLAPC